MIGVIAVAQSLVLQIRSLPEWILSSKFLEFTETAQVSGEPLITERAKVAGSLSFRVRSPVKVVRSSAPVQSPASDLVGLDDAVGLACVSRSQGDALDEPDVADDRALEDSWSVSEGEYGAKVAGAVGTVGALGGGSAEIADAPLELTIRAASAVTKIRPRPSISDRRSQ